MYLDSFFAFSRSEVCCITLTGSTVNLKVVYSTRKFEGASRTGNKLVITVDSNGEFIEGQSALSIIQDGIPQAKLSPLKGLSLSEIAARLSHVAKGISFASDTRRVLYSLKGMEYPLLEFQERPT